ncbi:MAG TPA: TonB-dependent receptor, partial [Longimicrobiales bacterium]
VPVVLSASAPPVDSVEVIRHARGAATATSAGSSEWFPRFTMFGLPHPRGELSEVLRLSTTADENFNVEGLPARQNVIAVEAIRHTTAADATPLRTAALPLSMFQSAELLTNPVDVEWSGFGGGLLNALARRGGREYQAEAYGSYGGNIGAGAETFDASSLSFADIQAGAFLSGPLSGDSARFALGIFGRRYQSPLAPGWAVTPFSTGIAGTVRDQFGVDVGNYVAPAIATTEAYTAFARVDWQISPSHSLALNAGFAGVPESAGRFLSSGPLSANAPLKTSDLFAGATLHSVLGTSFSNELRIGGGTSTAELTDSAGADAGVPFTLVVPESLVFGADAFRPQSSSRSSIQILDALHFQARAHHAKIGVSFDVTSVEETQQPGDRAQVFFGGAAQLQARQGVAIISDAASDAKFSTAVLGAFVQDTWRPQDGLELMAGVRYELESLPQDKVILNSEWLGLTGLDNTSIPASRARISPRFAASWDVANQHTWIFRVAGGLYFDRFDSNAFTRLIANDGRTSTRRLNGTLNWWPLTAAPDTGYQSAALTILTSEYQAPQSLRASAGLTRALGTFGALHLAAVFRETTNLPRVVDLNRVSQPIAQDQNGRPIYGTLQQQGGLIVAQPGSNRRFDTFDVVQGINADGTAEYQAVTAGLEWFGSDRLNLVARYTYSRATDDWVGAPAGMSTSQFDPGLDAQLAGSWSEGRSDFDAPHRVAVGAEVRAASRVAVAAVYRYRSGYPFTPGFPIGVDANGDGSADNDPAFINQQVTGADQLISSWDCLRSQVGRFAERNSCRGSGIHSLDARLGVTLFQIGGNPVELRFDALNLVQSDAGLVDNAFYRIDPAGQIVTGANGSVTLPLAANPDFGNTRVPLVPARMLRVGIQLKW